MGETMDVDFLKEWRIDMFRGIEKSKIKIAISIVFVCITLLAFRELAKIRGEILEYTNILLSIILLGIVPKLLYVFWEGKDNQRKKISYIGGSLFSFAYVTGMYLHYKNHLPERISGWLYLLFIIVGIVILVVPIMDRILAFLERVASWYQKKKQDTIVKMRPTIFLLLTWLLIFLCWMPMFLLNWPGNFIFDAPYQLYEVITETYRLHHPLLHTWLMGVFYRYGVSIGNVSLGYSFYTILQMLILSFAGARTITYLYKRKTPRVIWILSLLFYAFVPVNSIFSITATKDVLFAAFFLLFTIGIFAWFFDHKSFRPIAWIGWSVSGIFCLLLRNNAFFALVAIAPFFVIFTKEKKRKVMMASALLIIVGSTVLLTLGMKTSLHAYANDARKEALSVPIQQLARVASYREDDLDASLYQKIVQYIREEDLKNYNPYLSDPVKNNANEELFKSNFVDFLSLYLKVGAHFPGEYVASFMTNTLGFWYPGETEFQIAQEISTYHMLIGIGDEIEKHSFLPFLDSIHNELFSKANYRTIPILRQFFLPALYFWLILLAILFMTFKKKKKNIIVLGFMITYFLTLFLGPFVSLRYLYAIVVCLPFLMLTILDDREALW